MSLSFLFVLLFISLRTCGSPLTAALQTLSSMYCRVDRINNPIGLMLLCDTAFGKMYECPRDQYMTKAQTHSLHLPFSFSLSVPSSYYLSQF
jgi:hypothetical protein